MHADYVAVAEVVQDYFDGLYFSDSKRLSRVFHPKATYSCATDGTLLHRSMPEYFAVVDKRPSPASRAETRNDRIVSMEFAGPVTAFVRLECSIGERFFNDLLTLVRLDGRWQVIAKVFHYDVRTRA